MYLSIYLSIYLSNNLSLSLTIYLVLCPVYVSLTISPNPCISLFLCLSLSLYPSLSFYLSICLSVYLPISLYLYISVSLSISICISISIFNSISNSFSTSETGSRPSGFNTIGLRMCFVPQRLALIPHLNVQKWSETVSFEHYWPANVLRASTVCTFWIPQRPKGKGASLDPAPRRFSRPTLWPSRAAKHWKNTVFHDFSTFSCALILFLLTLSILWLLLFWLFLFSVSAHLCCFMCSHCRKFDFETSLGHLVSIGYRSKNLKMPYPVFVCFTVWDLENAFGHLLTPQKKGHRIEGHGFIASRKIRRLSSDFNRLRLDRVHLADPFEFLERNPKILVKER